MTPLPEPDDSRTRAALSDPTGPRTPDALVTAAVAATRSGAPAAALDLLAQARGAFGSDRARSAELDTVQEGIANSVRTAQQLWTAIHSDLAAGGTRCAGEKLHQLSMVAADIASQDGELAAAVMARLEVVAPATGEPVNGDRLTGPPPPRPGSCGPTEAGPTTAAVEAATTLTAAVTILAPDTTAVSDIWATGESDGRTKVAFRTPPDGTVEIYAAEGPGPAPIAPPGTRMDRAELANRSGIRLVGAGRRRVFDAHALGLVVYTAVTVAGDQVVVGASCEHLAAGRISNLSAFAESGRILLTFTLPPGVTEAHVRWHPDHYPTGPADPDSRGGTVTNTRLDIMGGYAIDDSGEGPLYVVVYPAVRAKGTARAVPSPVGTPILVTR